MSDYSVKYRLSFKNDERNSDGSENGQLVFVDICLVSSYGDDPVTVYDLVAAANPFTTKIINNDRDKFDPIRSTQATIQFMSDSDYDMTDFADAGDNDWIVFAYVDDISKLIFKGFLVLADMSQPFLPNPTVVTLTASDHLGILKDTPLVDFSGDNPMDYNNIGLFISWCLSLTGISLPLRAFYNIKEEDSYISASLSFVASTKRINFPVEYYDFFASLTTFAISGSQHNDRTYTSTGVGSNYITVSETVVDEVNLSSARINAVDLNWHFFKDIYLNAKTFEDQIGTCIDAYTALSRILGEDAIIFQFQGQWVIVRIDEFDVQQMYEADFLLGVYQGTQSPAYYNKEVGSGYALHPVLADRIMEEDRPLKSVKETFNYNLPLEIPCNVDFSRGDYVEDLPDETIDSVVYSAKKFDIDCWDKLWSNTSSDDPLTTDDIFIERLYKYVGYENSRYVVLKANATRFVFIMSSYIPVNKNDKFTLDIQRRLSGDISGGGFFRDESVQVRLYGDDGSFWTFQSKTSASDVSQWVACTSTFRTNQKFFSIEGDTSTEDETQSKSLYDGEAKPLPVSGKLKILIYASSNFGDDHDTYIDKIGFEYLPYVNGAYQKYTGQYQKVSRSATTYIAKREKEVYISDSPVKIFKGALFVYNGTDYVLPGLFYNAAVFPGAPPDSTYLHPFGELQVQSVWNQYRNANRIFTGTVRGLDSQPVSGLVNSPHLLHKYYLQDQNPNLSSRYFVLLDFEQNWKTCMWTGTFVEVYNIVTGKIYTDNHEFKYIT